MKTAFINAEGNRKSEVRGRKPESGKRKSAGSRAAEPSTLDPRPVEGAAFFTGPRPSTFFHLSRFSFQLSAFRFFFPLLLLAPIASAGLPPKPAKQAAKATSAQPVPVARWTFDKEVGGEFPATGSGSGIPLKKSGGIEVVDGRSGSALQFGAPGVAEIEQSFADLTSGQFTVMFWILKTGKTTGVGTGVGYATLFDAGYRDGVAFRIKQEQTIQLCINGVNGYLGHYFAQKLESQWVQIACTFDGEKTVLYANGEVIEKALGEEVSQKQPKFGSKMTVGSNAFNGAIDDLRIYDTALTAEQITAAEND